MVRPALHSFGGKAISTRASDYGINPVLVESRVTWDAESCADHPNPARGTFIIRLMRYQLLDLNLKVGDPVRAFVNADGVNSDGTVQPDRAVAYMEGYIDQLTVRRLSYADRAAGGVPYASDMVELTVESSDALAQLGRVQVGDTPWVINTVAARIYGQLQPAVGSRVLLDGYPYRDVGGYEMTGMNAADTVRVRFLDVDNRSALDVYRRTVAAIGRVALGLAGRVGMSWALAPAFTLAVTNGSAVKVPDKANTSRVPVLSLEDAPIQLGTDRMANKIKVDYTYYDSPAGTKETWFALYSPFSVNKYGEVNRTIKTDLIDENVTGLPLASPWLYQKIGLMLDSQSDPRWYFDGGLKVVARDLNNIVGLAELVDNASRYGRSVALVGDYPPEVGAFHRVRGSSFGFGADGEWHLELSLEPSDYSGPLSGTMLDAKPRTDLKLNTMRNITIGDLRNVAL